MARPLHFASTMHEKRPCPRCGREIDAVAKICPYCNADPLSTPRTVPATGSAQSSAAATRPTPVAARGPKKLVIAAIAAAAVAIAVIGGLIFLAMSDDGDGDRATETTTRVVSTEATSSQTPSSEYPQLTLGSQDPTSPMSRSVTTTPVSQPNVDIPAELQREDATALPSTEYAAILERSRAQEKRQPSAGSGAVDPRSITAPSPIPPAPRPQRRAEDPASAQEREPETPPTRSASNDDSRPPTPIAQPLPRFSSYELRQSGTVRLRLTVGADGRVKEVDLLETLPGITPKVIQAVQQWRFRPAERNGNAVEGTFTTDIFFKADD